MTASSSIATNQVELILRSRARLAGPINLPLVLRKSEAEGGCGVIGIASSVPIEGRHLLQSLVQMRNRANGKGGGAALAGIDPAALGVTPRILADCYLLAVAYLTEGARSEVERERIAPMFELEYTHKLPLLKSLDPAPPEVVVYFVRPNRNQLDQFAELGKLSGIDRETLEDEFVYQNSFKLNSSYYASLGEKRAFVLSHGKDLLALKLVGYGEDVFQVYGLESLRAHVWIGHHRYPTKGRVWHPGGAHPFVGLHEALVHNGDFANYASVSAYLAQNNIRPLFLTDTEVSVLVFDLLHRTFGYPLEYVIEALAPTTERDFAQLPEKKARVYQWIQAAHMHGSPDGPWFFLLAQTAPNGAGSREARLIGITDTSMLRPQVFALQQGGPGQPSIGFAASEKQAIDAALESLAGSDSRFGTRADLVWNARGGSHTDGGAFVFSVVRGAGGAAELHCRDKFGREIGIEESTTPYRGPAEIKESAAPSPGLGEIGGASAPSHDLAGASGASTPSSGPALIHSEVGTPLEAKGSVGSIFGAATAQLPNWSYQELQAFLSEVTGGTLGLSDQLELLSLLLDRRYPTGSLRRSSILSILDDALLKWARAIGESAETEFCHHEVGDPLPQASRERESVVVQARGFAAQGRESLALGVRGLVDRGFRRIILMGASGQRFIGAGLGAETEGVRIEVFGSSGDYLASGIDGAELVVHGSGQDQLAQIMKRGRLVVYGDVGQTFMYGAKGGEAYVMGNAAGRPMINAVGKPRVVINGTCLDYLAESFMAGDPLEGGGFVVLNGVGFDKQGRVVDLDSPYPGSNLFSLASGGAIFVRDPERQLTEDQLNGGQFAELRAEYWGLIQPMLEENERLFGIPIARLLERHGEEMAPGAVYRAIVPSGHKALQPEQAWVAH